MSEVQSDVENENKEEEDLKNNGSPPRPLDTWAPNVGRELEDLLERKEKGKEKLGTKRKDTPNKAKQQVLPFHFN